jgi:hypothetical protein
MTFVLTYIFKEDVLKKQKFQSVTLCLNIMFLLVLRNYRSTETIEFCLDCRLFSEKNSNSKRLSKVNNVCLKSYRESIRF